MAQSGVWFTNQAIWAMSEAIAGGASGLSLTTIGLAKNPVASLTRQSTSGDIIELDAPGYASRDVGSAAVVTAGGPPYTVTIPVSGSWINTGTVNWPFSTYAFGLAAGDILAWLMPTGFALEPSSSVILDSVVITIDVSPPPL